jgi:hypothetical protein
MDELADGASLYVRLPGLFSAGRVLALHRLLSLLLSLACEYGEPLLQCVEQLTSEEARVLVPLRQSSLSYAPYALVLSHLVAMSVEEA